MPDLPKKLYVQYMPSEAARLLLVNLQSELQANITTGHHVPANELHITVLHFGFVEETFKQLQAIQHGLNRQTYQEAVQLFIANTKEVLPRTCSVTIERLERFGPLGTTIALRCQPDSQCITAYDRTMQQLQVFANAVGIEDVRAIHHRPRALQLPDTFTPHITLFKSTHDVMHESMLPSSLIGRQLQVELFDLD